MRWTTDCKGPCGLPPARASGARGRRRARGRGRRRPRHLHQLAVGLALDQAVHVAVGRIVPDALRLQLQRVRVPALAPVVRRVARAVAPAAHMPADEADPQVLSARRGPGLRRCGAGRTCASASEAAGRAPGRRRRSRSATCSPLRPRSSGRPGSWCRPSAAGTRCGSGGCTPAAPGAPVAPRVATWAGARPRAGPAAADRGHHAADVLVQALQADGAGRQLRLAGRRQRRARAAAVDPHVLHEEQAADNVRLQRGELGAARAVSPSRAPARRRVRAGGARRACAPACC